MRTKAQMRKRYGGPQVMLKDFRLLPHEFLLKIAQTGLIGNRYVVSVRLQIKCAIMSAPYFSPKLRYANVCCGADPNCPASPRPKS